VNAATAKDTKRTAAAPQGCPADCAMSKGVTSEAVSVVPLHERGKGNEAREQLVKDSKLEGGSAAPPSIRIVWLP
jgi:hypothetical protein